MKFSFPRCSWLEGAQLWIWSRCAVCVDSLTATPGGSSWLLQTHLAATSPHTFHFHPPPSLLSFFPLLLFFPLIANTCSVFPPAAAKPATLLLLSELSTSALCWNWSNENPVGFETLGRKCSAAGKVTWRCLTPCSVNRKQDLNPDSGHGWPLCHPWPSGLIHV